MSVLIDSSLSVPVTEEQLLAFKVWIRDRYDHYEAYKASINTDIAINAYILSNILPQNMKTLWDESELYVNVRIHNSHIRELKLYRKRIMDKVRYMKQKLGKSAFRENRVIQHSSLDERRAERARLMREHRQLISQRRELIRQQQRQADQILRERIIGLYGQEIVSQIDTLQPNERQQIIAAFERRRQEIIQRLHEPLALGVSVEYTKTEIPSIEATLPMIDDCCICMDKHQLNSVIRGPCGHMIGKTCFQEWANKCKENVCCPLCRTNCNQVTEFVVAL